MVALAVVFAIVAVALVVFSEVLDFIGPHAVGDYWPVLRKFQLSRPVRAAALCAAVGIFLYTFYGEPLQEALAQTKHLFGGPSVNINFSPEESPAPLNAKLPGGAEAGNAPSPKVPPVYGKGYGKGTTLLVTGEERHAEKPDAPAKAEPQYSCDGPNESNTADEVAFEKMVRLYNERQFNQLLPVCTEWIMKDPAWPTPYLFCGLAQLGENNIGEASHMMREFQVAAKNSNEAAQGACRQARDFLMTHLSN